MENTCESAEFKPVELETLTVNAQIVSAFSMSSSLDNKISIIVEGGVFIYELLSNPSSEEQAVSFLKSCIHVTAMEPLGRLIPDKSGFLWNLKRKDVFEAVLDSTMYGLFEKSDPASSTTQIIQCEFSPLILNQSYIACLTNTGLLEIFKKEFKKWTSLINVTQLWIEHCGYASSKKYSGYNEFKKRALAIKITAIKWCSKTEPVLITSHKNGQICFWKMDCSSNSMTVIVSHSIKENFLPCSICLCHVPSTKSDLLIAGSLSGSLKCISIGSDTLQINHELDLWTDDDLISPNHIRIIEYNAALLVLVVKRHILLFARLIISSNALKLHKIKWLPFPSVITSLNECHNKFIVGLQNHNNYAVTINPDDLNHHFELINMDIKAKYKISYHCYGMAMSNNRALWMMVSSPKVAYDYLKEISDLTIFSNTIKTYKSLQDGTYCGLIEKISFKFPDVTLNDIADLLELKRLELLLDESKFRERYNYNTQSTNLELKLMLWEVKLKQISQAGALNETISDLEHLIMKRHAREKRKKYQEKIDILSQVEEKSLKAISYFLSNEKEREGLVCENCVICNCQTVFESVRISSCPNGHKFPRCCVSLLPCDKIPYVVCQNCDAVALISFVSDGTTTMCPLCDGILLPKTRFRTAVKTCLS